LGISGLGTQETTAQQAARQRAADTTEANRLQDIQTTQNATLFGAQMISPFLSEGLKTMFTTTPSGDRYQADWGKAIDKSLGGGGNSAMVNVSKGMDSQSLMAILKLLAAGA
jgi:hypothetical protein